MQQRLAASFVNLVHEAALKSFWRRKTLRRFLRQHRISEGFLASWNEDESKRDFLDRLFAKLPDLPSGQKLLIEMAKDLAQQEVFLDLKGWENSAQLIDEAQAAIAALRTGLKKLDHQKVTEEERRKSQERFRQIQEEDSRTRQNLDSLRARLDVLAGSLGTQQAGYDFQAWFFDLAAHFEVLHRLPYVSAGRQIDGSVTISGTTYLVETKFTTSQAGATDVDSFHKKVTDKADNTMGIMVSVSGYSSTAVEGASGRRTPLLLLDHSHLYFILAGSSSFQEVVDRVRRHASQTAESYLPIAAFNQ